MTTDFNERFGSKNDQRLDQDDFDPARFWFNVGYQEKVDLDEGTETRFISQSQGIGLDKFEDLTTESSNALCETIQAARNELMSQIMDVARDMDPGEDRIIGDAGRLQIHLRRFDSE